MAENLGSGEATANSVLAAAAPGQRIALHGALSGSCAFTARGRSDATGWCEDISEPWETAARVLIGNLPVPVIQHERLACCPGLDRILVEIPAGAPTGCFVPVVAQTGRHYGNIASISIGESNQPCSDLLNGFTLLTSRLRQGPVSWARILLFHGEAATERPGIFALATKAELATADFVRFSQQDFEAGFHYPALGACLARPFDSRPTTSSEPRPALDAGDLTLTGPWTLGLSRNLRDATYQRRLSATPFEGLSGDFLRPNDRYTIRGDGGAEVGPFLASMTLPDFIRWTNRDRLPFVLRRSRPVIVTWAGGDPATEFVSVRGFSFNRYFQQGVEFLCTAPADARTFTLPESVMVRLPDSEQDMFLSVAAVPLRRAPNFTAPGLAAGFFVYETAGGRNFALRP